LIRPVAIIALGFSIASIPVEAQGIDSAWVIRGGSYAGQSVKLDRALATKKSARFWRISSIKGDRRIVGWNPSSLPAKVAFNNRRISTGDSAAFWSILRAMEEDMGMRLFEPASLASDTDDQSIIVVDLKPMMNDGGVTYITWSSSGAPYDAHVYVGSTSLLHNSRIVAHEMMHALGFGHTNAWASIMSPGGAGPDRLTAEDVAYAQAAFDSRAATEREDMWERLALAISREGKAKDDSRPDPDCGGGVDFIRAGAQSVPAGLPTVDQLRSLSCYH
jgi:hypothetical protein